MHFENEKELEDMLHSHYRKTNECRIMGEHFNCMLRQLKLPGYGILDMLGLQIEPREEGFVDVCVVIYELKQHEITAQDVAQISRYYAGILRYIRKCYGLIIEESGDYFSERGFNIMIRGCIVGKGYSGSDTCFLVDSIPWLNCYHFNVGFDGIKFEHSAGWYNEGESNEKLYNDGIDIDSILLSSTRIARRLRREFDIN